MTMPGCIARMGAGLLGMLAVTCLVSAENTPIPKPDCDATKMVSVRYSATSERLYLETAVPGERGGCVTLAQIFVARRGSAPLYPVDPVSGERVVNATGTWLLTDDLFVEDGITLNVRFGRVQCCHDKYEYEHI